MTYECNCIARNPIQPNLVAAGYERSAKYEQKSCLLVWDINQ
jgi:WD40 repeat protein